MSEIMAEARVVLRGGQEGFLDGIGANCNGLVYNGNFEDDTVNIFNPTNGVIVVFTRHQGLELVDVFSVATGGSFYFTVNQLCRTKAHCLGTDRRVKPYSIHLVPRKVSRVLRVAPKILSKPPVQIPDSIPAFLLQGDKIRSW